MSKFYVTGMSADDIKKFFAPIAEDKRPKIVSDADYPAIWDHASDGTTVIATENPRADTDAKELTLTDRQAEDVMAEIAPPAQVTTEDVTVEVPPAEEPEPKIQGPLTFRDRGFKVGRIS